MEKRHINLTAFARELFLACFVCSAFSWTAPSPRHPSRLSKEPYSNRPSHFHASQMDNSATESPLETVAATDGNIMTTLAGDYLVSISSENHEHSWALFPLNGAQAAQALLLHRPKAENPVFELTCVQTEADALEVEVSLDNSKETIEEDLLLVLQLVLLQMSAKRTSPMQKELRISVGSSKDILVADVSSEDGVEALFSSLVKDISSVEWVEMVTASGEVLGKVPRPLVHKFNLLHRGIGMFVTKDKPMLDHLNGDFPPLYTHRRAATKRIFPSLYDMFVGGVSLADEPPELTARREVAEELGLTRALEATDALSEPILDCVVCTNLNRCFVTLFSYTMNTNEEEVSWQEEEVAWGDFVPYPIIVAAADRSIQRFAEKKEWPGTYLPIQSEPNGSRLKGLSYEGETWMEWDFVPDGLLVWEAWLKKLEKKELVLL